MVKSVTIMRQYSGGFGQSAANCFLRRLLLNSILSLESQRVGIFEETRDYVFGSARHYQQLTSHGPHPVRKLLQGFCKEPCSERSNPPMTAPGALFVVSWIQ